ncbi:hypothetical protein L6452_20051 [Arctium lappa]|uniref:Uncharacterized protein n=1 Tax=Arctium lappa TaxID=4217 RepID=A0ACB9BAT2_ARCLA|nr:hypothetical protein L6452_20051 [Arctium lappa]
MGIEGEGGNTHLKETISGLVAMCVFCIQIDVINDYRLLLCLYSLRDLKENRQNHDRPSFLNSHPKQN